MERYESLRKEFPRFFYRSYEVEDLGEELHLVFHFEIEGLSKFAPEWRFPKKPGIAWENDALTRRMAFSLGLVELVSYWKITCSPEVIVEAGSLCEEEIVWWKQLYFDGLGEFFYVNHIENVDPETFMHITSAGEAITGENLEITGNDGVLVPIGGGKDSVVTLELLKKAGVPVYGYIINPRGATLHTAEVAGLCGDHLMKVKRTLDARMLELNRQGYLNGHTPFSALVAFSTLLAARLLGLSRIALSNESSANESTVPGTTVNHQYSKSFQFEKDFHEYSEKYLPQSALYFSLLRPLSEFQIAKFFARCTAYHNIFRSCNAGSKTDSWCGHCPKCLFVYVILSPFLEPERLREIFGADMLNDVTMAETLDKLTGILEEKPFECVGSRDEINTALVLAIKKFEDEKKELPLLLARYKETDLYGAYRAAGDTFSSYFDEENLVPGELLSLVRENCVEDK